MPVSGPEPASGPASGASRIARAPVTIYLLLAFASAWLLWGYWVPAMPPGGIQVSVVFIICALAGGLAPSLAAFAVVRRTEGLPGVRRLWGAITRGRPPRTLAAFAILAPFAMAAVSVLLQARFVGPLTAPPASLIPMALVWPLMAAFGEEFGWRGFLFPRLASHLGLAGGALLVGLIWGLWHLPADYIGLKAYGDWFWAAFLISGPLLLTGHALVMAWIWTRSDGNLGLMLAYHFGVTCSAILSPTAGAPGPSGVLAAAMGPIPVWVLAGALFAFGPRQRQPG